MMKYILGCWLLASFILAASIAAESQAAELLAPPQWIWLKKTAQPARFVRGWNLPRSIQTAELKFAADFCSGTVVINGRRVLTVAPYCQLQTLDVTNFLRRRDNEIAIEAQNVCGPAAVALSLVVTHQEGEPTILLTDDAWNADDRGPVLPQFWGVGRRGIELSPFENYEQWQQAKTDSTKKTVPKFWTVPGFEVTELRVAQPEEGSWIALAFDAQGRVVISREDQGFLRMTLDEARKSIARVEAVASDLKECRGLAFDGDVLYAKANNSLGLFRLKIDEQGQVRDQELMREFPGKVGHGRNDIALVRGNKGNALYQIHGDSVEIPQESIRDLISPLNESRTKAPSREGSLLRYIFQERQWELVCQGLRNPYGIALHESGEPFTFDADNEFDMGTPWYRPTRILHLMTGGDTGYRESTGVFPPRFHDQPDHAPPLLDIGRSSPTSVMFGYELKFPEPYKKALFALDWTYGRVIAVHLAPRGKTFRAAAELFLQGRPLNVTDIAAGPDGDMYLITGGRKTQSALYRVSFTGKAPLSPVQPEWRMPVSTKQSSGNSGILEFGDIAAADPVRRHAARIKLERGELDLVRISARSIVRPYGIDVLLALARARQKDDVPLLFEMLQHWKLAEGDLTQQFVWIRIVSLCHETAPEKCRNHREALTTELRSLAKSLQRDDYGFAELRVAPEGTSDELRRRVILLLATLEAPNLPEIATAQLLKSNTQEDQLAGLLATRSARTGWTLETRREQLRVLNEIPRMVGGAGLPPFEKWLRPQIIATLSDAERKELHDLLEPKSEASEPLPPPRKHVQKWSLDDLNTLYAENANSGDPKKGETIFRDALCNRCHRVNVRGAAVGPDLTHVSRRFSRRDILESIVQPSLSVAENFRVETVLTEDGKTYTGRVINEGDYRSEKLTLQLDALQPDKIVTLDKKEISEHRTLPVSPMPNGLLDTFTLEEIRDLLAYLAP
jgi:putative heme-binding domain-containing protein